MILRGRVLVDDPAMVESRGPPAPLRARHLKPRGLNTRPGKAAMEMGDGGYEKTGSYVFLMGLPSADTTYQTSFRPCPFVSPAASSPEK
jgi:hypothetical protein